MKEALEKIPAKLGTAPVFLTGISTILGAVMFLRFGYAVGEVGFWGTIAIVVIGHLVTIPTSMAIAEIATNQKVEGGGEYFIISRSFGLNIGGAIGIFLYLSQAVSVAFYVIAFSEAFKPLLIFSEKYLGFEPNIRFVSIPATILLLYLILKKGKDLGLTLLYVVVAVLLVSMVFFFIGSPELAEGVAQSNFTFKDNNFFLVFAIVFPAFTGMTAGVGLSGDLKDPKKSIPLGTMSATIIGMIIYIFIAYKLAANASTEDLKNTEVLVMGKIALWGPIILIGLAAATISSAIGSVLVAPRTLQAIGGDRIFPNPFINRWLSKNDKSGEPFNATLVTAAIAFTFVAIGDVNAVAQIISMFFMVTYGSLCLISFFEHFASDPSYRPAFKSRWYISLLGAVLCIWLMFKMNAGYATAAVIFMALAYISISYYQQQKGSGQKGIATIFKGVIWQLSRRMQVFLQKGNIEEDENWRPSVVCVSEDSFERYDAFELIKWISYKYGFGTYIHLIKDYLSKESNQESKKIVQRLLEIAQTSSSNVYIDTMVSPSYTASIAQMLQLPGISGRDNNMMLFEYPRINGGKELTGIIDNYKLVNSVGFDVCVLGTSAKGFGYKRQIHIWITNSDFENANLMILLAYIILGHPQWNKGFIKIFALFPAEEIKERKAELIQLSKSGRLPISQKNIEVIAKQDATGDIKHIVCEKSLDADLTIIGFRAERIKNNPRKIFEGFDDGFGNILFVNTVKEKPIT